jgi:hypothetical protein
MTDTFCGWGQSLGTKRERAIVRPHPTHMVSLPGLALGTVSEPDKQYYTEAGPSFMYGFIVESCGTA